MGTQLSLDYMFKARRLRQRGSNTKVPQEIETYRMSKITLGIKYLIIGATLPVAGPSQRVAWVCEAEILETVCLRGAGHF
jgi:hypothetical protein